MKCKKCGSSSIRRRSNYTHGTKSGATKTMNCKQCGSADIEVVQDNRRGRFRKR